MLTLEEKMFNNIGLGLGLNKYWFSRTTKCIPMISCIYFTATRNITASDIVNVFENVLNIGTISQEYVNIVPVLNKNYNHVFIKIKWNDTVDAANFVNEILVNSSVKVYHNKGYWVCRMSKNPLKMRHSKRCVKFASFYCNNSDSESECESEEQNVSMQVKEIEDSTKGEDGVSMNFREDGVSTKGEDKVSMNFREDGVSTNREDGVSTKGEEEEEDFYVIKEEVKEEINSVVE
jgi:hypothetical protein